LKKKVVRIIKRLNVGGASKHVSWLSNGLDHKGWHNILVSGKVEADENDMSEFLDAFNIEHIESENLKRSISPKDDYKAIVEIYQLLKKGKTWDSPHTYVKGSITRKSSGDVLQPLKYR